MTVRAPIIITGGAQRLGLACAQALVEKNYEVIITYRKVRERLKVLEKQGIRCIQADFSNQAGVDSFISLIQNDYQSLRGIIHNASEWESEELNSDTAALMEKMWQVHVFAPYRMNLAFEGLLYAASDYYGTADIIHMTDYVAEKGSDKHIAYASSKAGLANLTVSFAKRLAPKVKVNSISPSLLMFNENDSSEYKEHTLNKSLLHTEPGEQELVLAIKYILGSLYMTGRTLSLDGGRHLA